MSWAACDFDIDASNDGRPCVLRVSIPQSSIASSLKHGNSSYQTIVYVWRQQGICASISRIRRRYRVEHGNSLTLSIEVHRCIADRGTSLSLKSHRLRVRAR